MTPQQYADQIKYPTFALGFFAYLLSVAAAEFEPAWRDAFVAVFCGGFFSSLCYLIAYHTAAFLPFVFERLPAHVEHEPIADDTAVITQPARETWTQRNEFTAPPQPMRQEPDYNPRHLSLFFKAIDAGDIQVGETVTLAKLNTANISRFDNRGGDSSAVKFLDYLRRVGVVNGEDILIVKPPPPHQMASPHLF